MPKKSSTKISEASQARIVELSLLHPTLGARRLAQQLKEEKIPVSESAVYNILRRNGLQSRTKRLQQLEEKYVTENLALTEEQEQALEDFNPDFRDHYVEPLPPEPEAPLEEAVRIDEVPPTKISEASQARIVELSLLHPALGARRLAQLLKEEKIPVSESAVYKILRRNGLQSRAKRLQQLEEKFYTENLILTDEQEKALEEFNPEFRDHYIEPLPPEPEAPLEEAAIIDEAPPADQAEPAISPETIKTLLAEELPVEADIEDKEPEESLPPPVRKPSRPVNGRRVWIFSVVNALLLLLIVLFVSHAVQKVRKSETDVDHGTPAERAGVLPDMKHASAASPLSNYRTIWERNIFGTLGRENPDSQKNVAPEPLPPVSKNSELKLMGTVLASDSAMSRAIIYDRSTRKQNIYHEGDRAGKAQIKKILRNSVIIDAGQGEETLAMKIEKSAKGPLRFPTSPRIPGTVRPTSPRRPAKYRLEQAEIDSQIGDPETFVEQLRVTPYTQKGEPQGLRVSGISTSNPLRRLGFRNGDVIQQVNDETVTSQDQAIAIMQQFKAGGDFTVQVLRRGRPRELQLQIE